MHPTTIQQPPCLITSMCTTSFRSLNERQAVRLKAGDKAALLIRFSRGWRNQADTTTTSTCTKSLQHQPYSRRCVLHLPTAKLNKRQAGVGELALISVSQGLLNQADTTAFSMHQTSYKKRGEKKRKKKREDRFKGFPLICTEILLYISILIRNTFCQQEQQTNKQQQHLFTSMCTTPSHHQTKESRSGIRRRTGRLV